MCDNKKLTKKCSPCVNDYIGHRYSDLDNVIANNENVKNCFKEIKCQLLAFINSLSVEFLQNIDIENTTFERDRLNTVVESLISGIHQAIKTSNGQIEPYFQLWLQNETSLPTPASCSDTTYKNESTCTANSQTWTPYVPAATEYSLGAGWLDGTTTSGCYDSNGDATTDTYANCTTPKTWNGSSTDVQYDAGNLPTLYPNKISLNINIHTESPNEIIYVYVPTFQFVYNPMDSSLKLKWGDVNSNRNSVVSQNSLFSVVTDNENFKSQVLNIVPPSYDAIGDDDDSEIWDNPVNAYNFIKNDLILQNIDFQLFMSKVDQAIRQCELANTSLNLKKKLILLNQ